MNPVDCKWISTALIMWSALIYIYIYIFIYLFIYVLPVMLTEFLVKNKYMNPYGNFNNWPETQVSNQRRIISVTNIAFLLNKILPTDPSGHAV